ncbi:sugar transferase [uncultured Muribaculum sp.]|uniref:sugar transferase n=1 Tax=uncultured Muribaculum sp. TaxID=1918613 RepID=UPI0025F149F1|nr:sugar transferase [uncultured Muribaculum sp.]
MQRHRVIYISVDFITTAFAVLLYNTLRYHIDPAAAHGSLAAFLWDRSVMLEQVLFPILMIGIYWLSGYYNNVFLKSRSEELGCTMLSSLLGTAIFFVLALINNGTNQRMTIYILILCLWGILFLFVYTGRLLITTYVRREVYSGKWMRNTMVVGRGEEAVNMAQRLQRESRWSGMRILGCIAPDEDLEHNVKIRRLDCLVLMPQDNSHEKVLDTLYRILPLGVEVLTSPDLYRMLTSQMRIDKIAGEPLANIGQARVPESTINVKRLCDIVVGLFGLLLTIPVMSALAIAIRCESSGPVIFSQERIGKNKKPFTLYKLRSMKPDAEPDGPALSIPHDSRVTRVGRFMRKYRLDELPQFWNVLRGDMSLVGPRPERAYYVDRIMARAPYYILLQQIRPGLTSLGMVKYGYASDIDAMLERLKYDLMYLERISFSTDFKIMIYTVRTVLTGKGI